MTSPTGHSSDFFSTFTHCSWSSKLPLPKMCPIKNLYSFLVFSIQESFLFSYDSLIHDPNNTWWVTYVTNKVRERI